MTQVNTSYFGDSCKTASKFCRLRRVVPAAAALLLGACTSHSFPERTSHYSLAPQTATSQVQVRPEDSRPLPGQAPVSASPHGPGDLNFVQYGEGLRNGRNLNVDSEPDTNADITINLVDVPSGDAVQQVLGGILKENYVIEANLTGTITLQTARPVSRSGALRLLDSALRSKGASIASGDDFIRIVQGGGNADGSGASTGTQRVIALDYVSADSLQKVFSGMAQSGVTVTSDTDRNVIVLNGSRSALDDAEALVDVFDVNWMRGMSFAATPVQYTSASRVVDDLDAIFRTGMAGPISGVVRFVPLDRLNVVLTITGQASYLDEAGDWIGRLDRSGGQAGQRFYVIPIQNRPATEIADILRDTLTAERTGGSSNGNGVAPGERTLIESTESDTDATGSASIVFGASADGKSIPAAKVFADDANNSLVALATPEQFGMLEGAISQLDATPNQVFLEATIAEVTLTDDLSYGLTWFFQSGEFDLSFTDIASGAVSSQFPGFSALFSGENGRAALSAVAGVTDVKILSAPSLMVLDNRTAVLQVGDQVPVVTQSAVSVTNPDAPIVNSVSLRDTGIILNVTPRVNDGGLVILEIDQEVSDVVATQSSGIDSPTIQQRRISTSVAVQDGESVALGGLMRERITDTRTKVPLLGDLPLIGAAFSTTGYSTQRTELLVLITPRVVRGRESAFAVTDELRKRMKSVESAFFRSAPVPLIVEPTANSSSDKAVSDLRLDNQVVEDPVAVGEPAA
ncbi:type II secretion system secretin GspD [Hyphomonas sp. BRH_c22]|uniref:type II secretion system secretin GspD n=1 Tax=Hyphomonas sp. BRH_c22 TaxID=1629710 RepID=UPI000A3EA22F|nr:type II secretion system secretin GspD [Hyphomonas sp. BRH_c22]